MSATFWSAERMTFLPPTVSAVGQNCPENVGLRQELLVDAPPYPAQVKLLSEASLRVMKKTDADEGEQREPFARLFEIVRPGDK